MKLIKLISVAAASTVLVACGGGGDNAGNLTEFSTNVDEWTVKSSVPGCSTGGAEKWVTIIGGQAPFRIRNSSPDNLQIDRTEVTGKDPVFKMTTLGGCAEFSVTVLDYHSQVASIDIKLEEGDEEEE
ncbi:MAG: hypothetical protein ACLGG8_00690 [Gammaproteobacteria bacterium]